MKNQMRGRLLDYLDSAFEEYAVSEIECFITENNRIAKMWAIHGTLDEDKGDYSELWDIIIKESNLLDSLMLRFILTERFTNVQLSK